MQAGGNAVDLDRPLFVLDCVQHRHIAQQRGVGLAFLFAMRTQPVRHAAGMDVGDEQESCVDRLDAPAGLGEGRAQQGGGNGEASQLREESAARSGCWRAAIHRRTIEHGRSRFVQFVAPQVHDALIESWRGKIPSI